MELLIKLVECLNISIFPVLFFSVVALVCKYLKTGYRLPPGPMGLPFFGYYLFLQDNFPKQMDRLAKSYGPVFRISVGSSELIMLSSYSHIKEAYSKPEFSSRPRSKIYDMFQGYGITNINGSTWQTQRRYLYGQLRQLGMRVFGSDSGKQQCIIMDELIPLLSTLKGSKGESFNPDPYLTLMASNVLSVILMSKKFTNDDPDYRKMTQLNKEGFELFAKADLSTNIPLMKYIPRYANACNVLQDHFETEKKIMRVYVAESRANFDPEAPANDIISAYLLAEHDAIQNGQDVCPEETDRQVMQVIMDLYSGGSENMKSAFSWAFLILLHYPEVAKQIQQELDATVGRDRLPELKDMLNLTYTKSVISEMLRLVTIIPLAMHAANEDTTVGGYLVPKQRFIDENGRYFRPTGFVPFGFGNRQCIAEIMAKNQILLLVSCVLHAFNLQKPDTMDLPDLEEVFTFANNPKQYHIRFLPRDDLNVNIDESLSSYGKMT